MFVFMLDLVSRIIFSDSVSYNVSLFTTGEGVCSTRRGVAGSR